MASLAYFKRTLPAPTATVDGFVCVLNEDWFLQANASALDGTTFANGGGNLIVYEDAALTSRLPIHVISFVTGASPSVEVRVRVPSVATGQEFYISADDTQTTQPLPSSSFGQYETYQDVIGQLDFNTTSNSSAGNDVVNYASSINASSVGNPTQVLRGWQFNGTDQYVDASDLKVSTSGAFTLKEIVQFTGGFGSVDQYAFGMGPNTTSEYMGLAVDVSAGDKLKIFSQGETPGNGTTTIAQDVVHYLVLTWTGTRFNLYLNGQFEYSVTPNGSDWKNNIAKMAVAARFSASAFNSPLKGIVSSFSSSNTLTTSQLANYEYLNQSDPSNFGVSSDWTIPSVGGVDVAITETLSPTAESSTLTVTAQVFVSAAVTESLSSFQESSQAQFTEQGSVELNITETLSPIQESSGALFSISVNSEVTEVLNPYSESSVLLVSRDLTATITETLSQYQEFSSLRLPTNWVDKQKSTTDWSNKQSSTTIWIDKG